MCLLATINRRRIATNIFSAQTANLTLYATSSIIIIGCRTYVMSRLVVVVLLEQSLALFCLMLAKITLAHFLTALVALNPSLLAMVVQMGHVVIKAQLGLSTLVHTSKRGIPQHALHRLATVPKIWSERLLTRPTRLSTGTRRSRRQLLAILETRREARLADLLATIWAVSWLDGQVGAVRAGELVKVAVIARVQLEQFALDVFKAEILAALFLAYGEGVIV